MWYPWETLRRVTHAHRSHRLGRADAERLLDGVPAADDRFAALAAVLAAAAGPAQPHELAGEPAAGAAYSREYRTRPRSRPVRRPRLRIGAVVAASVVALLAGSTAYAAGTGRLPDVLQRTFEHLVPGTGSPSAAPPATTGPAPGSGRPASSPAPSPSAGATPAAQLLRLCQDWIAFRADPHARPVTAQDRRALAAAAGGESAINGFCDRLVTPAAEPTSTTVKPGNPKPGNPKPGNPSQGNPSPGNGRPSHPKRTPPR